MKILTLILLVMAITMQSSAADESQNQIVGDENAEIKISEADEENNDDLKEAFNDEASTDHIDDKESGSAFDIDSSRMNEKENECNIPACEGRLPYTGKRVYTGRCSKKKPVNEEELVDFNKKCPGSCKCFAKIDFIDSCITSVSTGFGKLPSCVSVADMFTQLKGDMELYLDEKFSHLQGYISSLKEKISSLNKGRNKKKNGNKNKKN